MTEYPKMIYRDGAEIDVNGIKVDTLVVHGEDEELQALDAGWRVSLVQHPLDHEGDGRPGGSRPRLASKPLQPNGEPGI